MIGRVLATKMNKTVTILVDTPKVHPLYKKTYTRTKKYLVHDELGVSEGDLVEVVKVAPISKNKHWKVAKVVGKDIVAVVEKEIAAVTEAAIEEVLPAEEVESKAVEAEAVVEVEKPKKVAKKATKAKEKGVKK